MRDSEYVFRQEIRDKKSVGRNAKYMNRRGKGVVKMPSDYLSKKEKERLNGPMATYDMGKPMSYKDFKKMPDDLQKAYIEGLVEKFHPNNYKLGELFGVTHTTIENIKRRLGIPSTPKGKRCGFKEKEWDEWIAGETITQKVLKLYDEMVVEEKKEEPKEEVLSENPFVRIEEKKKSKREVILDMAKKCVMGEREQDYGSPEQNFKTIADMWNAYLKIDKIEPKDVAAMLALLKIARIASGNGKEDNWVDLAGYAACGGELEAYGR